jgi:hypothetical protein
MKDKNLTECLKFRISKGQKAALEQTAKDRNCSVSDCIRDILFNSSNLSQDSDIVRAIKDNLIKNKIYNRINSCPVSESIKKTLRKELIEDD